MSINLNEFDTDQKSFVEFGIKNNLDERLLKFLANKNFSANKMWALYFAIQNKIDTRCIKILSNSNFNSTQIYKIIDAINDKVIDNIFLLNYNFDLSFNIQFAIYKKNNVLTDEWKEFIVTLFPKDINLNELDFLISFIDDNIDLNLIKKYIKKPKDINYFVNLFSIVKSNINDDEFLKLILRENPNYNKTAAIIDLKEYVNNALIKAKLLKLNVKQLYLILDLYTANKSNVIIEYLLDYKCRISNVDEIELIRTALENIESSKSIKDDTLKVMFDIKCIPQKIVFLSELLLEFKSSDAVKFGSIFKFPNYSDYQEVIQLAKDNKLKMSEISKYFRNTFKVKNAIEQINNIIQSKKEDDLFDYIEKTKAKSA